MCDCFWSMVCCDAEDCANCGHRITFSSERGQALFESYQKDVELVIAPVQNQYKKLMEATHENH